MPELRETIRHRDLYIALTVTFSTVGMVTFETRISEEAINVIDVGARHVLIAVAGRDEPQFLDHGGAAIWGWVACWLIRKRLGFGDIKSSHFLGQLQKLYGSQTGP